MAISNKIQYRLICDEDSHWYVIPENMSEEFYRIAALEGGESFPAWAVAVNSSPNSIRFPSFKIR